MEIVSIMVSMLSSVVWIVILGGAAFLLFRNKGGGERRGWDAYFYIVAFITLGLLFWAVADLVRIGLEGLWEKSTAINYAYGRVVSTSSSTELRRITMRLATILVALPIWAWHFFKTQHQPAAKQDLFSKKIYAGAVLFICTLLGLGMGSGMVYEVLNSIVGVSDGSESLAYFIPYFAAAAGTWVWHYKLWQEAREAHAEKGDETTVKKDEINLVP